MIPGQQKYVIGSRLHNEVEVLVYSVGCTLLPAGLLAVNVRLEQTDAAPAPVKVPWLAYTDMVLERIGPILGDHGHVVDVGVDTVAERKIDDPILARERDRRLSALLCEDA